MPRLGSRDQLPWPRTWRDAVPTSCSEATPSWTRLPLWTGRRAISVCWSRVASTSLEPSATRRGASTTSSADEPVSQGDPGSTQFYIALDDDLMRRFGGDRIRSIMDWAGMEDDVPIENGMINKSIENAQVKVESYHFDMRKHLVEYDDVVNTHRDVIYSERNKVLSGTDLKSNIQEMLGEQLSEIVHETLGDGRPANWDIDGFLAEVGTILPPPPDLMDYDPAHPNGTGPHRRHPPDPCRVALRADGRGDRQGDDGRD